MTARRTTRPLRLAALAATGALLLSGCGSDFSVYSLPLPGGADLGDDPYTVTVQFEDVLDLVPQSAVKVDDVTVGKVDGVSLDGYTAEVELLIREDVKLPDNAVAEIRQTSLLGEKFVSLAPPPVNPSPELLGDGDRIELDRTGRNTEVEEVLGALSFVLNGGGVGQLKTITVELNKALKGREGSVKSVLDQLRIFTTQFDDNRTEIVAAIERVNQLAVDLNDETPVLQQTLDELPGAVASIDRQRDDLVRMLSALDRLSAVGTQVIRASKASTIDSLRALAPTLRELARAGDALPKALQVVLTFPFVDAVVGQTPAQARDLHMGDYTNLSAQLDIDLRQGAGLGLPVPGTPPIDIPGLPDLPLPNLPIPTLGLPDLTGGLGLSGPKGGGGSQGGGGGGLLGGGLGGLLGLGRAAVGPTATPSASPSAGASTSSGPATVSSGADAGVDTDLAALLLWGAMKR